MELDLCYNSNHFGYVIGIIDRCGNIIWNAGHPRIVISCDCQEIADKLKWVCQGGYSSRKGNAIIFILPTKQMMEILSRSEDLLVHPTKKALSRLLMLYWKPRMKKHEKDFLKREFHKVRDRDSTPPFSR